VSADLRHARDDLEAKIEETQRRAGEAVFEFVSARADVAAESAAEFARAAAKSTDRDEPARPTRAEIRERITEVSPRRFRQFIAYTWSRLGYETTLLEDEEDDIDVIATQEHPVPEKQLLVTEQAADQVTRETVLQWATVRDADRNADVVAFVTTGDVTQGARDVAAGHNVKLIDGERLCDILVTEGLSPDADTLDERSR
jgi:restriction endonuclease Mrr